MSIKSYQLHNLARFFQLFLSFISFIVLIFHIQKNASEKLNTEEEKIQRIFMGEEDFFVVWIIS